MSEKIKILLAEDEPSLALIIKESLETRNFSVHVCQNGEEASNEFLNQKFDVVVLDVMMPLKDGFTVAKEIRQTDKNIPMIFLTAKSQTQDVVEGFTIGGNDYLKKPFSMEELIIRIQALLNRNFAMLKEGLITIGNYQFDFVKQILIFDATQISLTYREAEILQMLISNKDNLVDRSYILNKLWGNDDFFNGRSLDVFITKLRKKLAYDSNIQIINSRSEGFKIIF